MPITYRPIDTVTAQALRAGGPDAYGNAPERKISDGMGVPCRHCLRFVPAGAPYLVLAHRPFDDLHAYTETGPIFLCADPCEAGGGSAMPEFLDSPGYILRGYGKDERIVYGTGSVTPREAIPTRAATLLARDDIAFVHVRSASNNCFHCRIERIAATASGG